MQNFIGEYIRDNKRRRRGYLLAYRDSEKQIRIGWSLYAKNKEKIRFDSYSAKALAYMRAHQRVTDVAPSIKKDYDAFKQRCRRYFRTEVN